MIYTLHTKHTALSIDIKIQTFSSDVVIVGYNPHKKNTEYFNLLIAEPISQTYTFNLPQSPNELEIIIMDLNEGNSIKSLNFIVKEIKVRKLTLNPLFLDEDTSEFIKFMNEFAEHAGYNNIGTYFSDKSKFRINFYNKIPNSNGTPSRVHMGDGYIDVSKNWFDKMTIPSRKAILIHEFAHSNLQNELINQNNNNEIEKDADNEALKLYIALGNPKFEWMYAWTHIFQNHESHFERLNNSMGNLRNYE